MCDRGLGTHNPIEVSPSIAPEAKAGLLEPTRLWSREEVLARPSIVPATAGAYAWFFRVVPHPDIALDRCVDRDGLPLLYVGVAPKAPPAGGKPPTDRPCGAEFATTMEGTLTGRRSDSRSGVSWRMKLGVALRRVGGGNRLTFAEGEQVLSRWMSDNALVAWVASPHPWVLEHELISAVHLPLNLQGNRSNPFWKTLTAVRAAAKARARGLPVA